VPGRAEAKRIAQSGHMSWHSLQDVQASGLARYGVPSSFRAIASNGQKWAQIPQRLHRTGSKTGFFSPALSLKLELLVAGMHQLYISGSFGEHLGDVFMGLCVFGRMLRHHVRMVASHDVV
jgi:hypothetical protein